LARVWPLRLGTVQVVTTGAHEEAVMSTPLGLTAVMAPPPASTVKRLRTRAASGESKRIFLPSGDQAELTVPQLPHLTFAWGGATTWRMKVPDADITSSPAGFPATAALALYAISVPSGEKAGAPANWSGFVIAVVAPVVTFTSATTSPAHLRVGSSEGAAAIRGFHEDWIGSYEEYENQLEAQDLGNDVSFVVLSLDARPAGSAGRVQERWGFVVTWAAGMIVQVIASTDIDGARAAAERLAQERADG
jgi:hypothetical protein